MRIRSALFALLVACGSEGPSEAPVIQKPAQPPRAQPSRVPQVAMIALPAYTAMPLEQVSAPWALTASDGSGLQATRVEAKAVVQGPLAFTELHLYFANTEDRIREGTFAITLPPGAAVSRFAMETDGHLMEAEVVEKQVARRAYEDFLHQKQDPALMEKGAGNQFTARVFPIPAKGTKHLVLSFSQELPGQRYVLPLRGLPTVERLDVELAVTNPDGSRAPQVLHKRDWQPTEDFVSAAPTSAAAIASGELVIAQVSPFDQATVAKDVPTAMTLLVDTSASRALGFERYTNTVRDLVSDLATRYPGLELEVLAFDQDTQAIYRGPAKQFGKAHVDAMRSRGAAGASDLAQALGKLERPNTRVAIITDGVVTAGSAGAELAAKVRSLGAQKVARVDVVMVGGIRDQALADSLVTAGLSRAGAVLDLDQRIAEVATGLGERVMTEIDVEVAGATWVFPRIIKTARPGQPTMVYARFAKPITTLEVTVGKQLREIATVAGTPALIERATAAAEISDLEAKLAVAKPDDTKAMRAEIVKKAVAARVISSQTSMLVLESNSDYARFGIDRKALADILVVGPNGVEQQNRTSVAIARPRAHRPAESKNENFALKDPTDPSAVRNESRDRMQGVHISAGASMGAPGQAMKRDLDEGDDKAKEATAAPMEAPARRPASSPRSEPRNDFRGGGGGGEVWPPADSPAPLKGKLAEIDRAIRRGNVEVALEIAQAWHGKDPGDVLALIGLGESLEAKHDQVQAARIYGSIIDLFPGRADLRRFAGERLERIGGTARVLAADTYRHAVEERPDHLTGHRLLAYALLRNGQHAEAFAAILKGLEQKYPDDRFAGGQRVLTEDAGLIAAAYVAAHPEKKPEIVAALRKHKASLPTRASTRFIMYWETDANDVDFHIQDAHGGHAFYSNPQLPSGGELYADITTGYGPECFTIPGRAKAGPYKLSINYYSQGPMGYGMGLLQIIKHDGKGNLEFQDRPYVIMNDQAYVKLGSFR